MRAVCVCKVPGPYIQIIFSINFYAAIPEPFACRQGSIACKCLDLSDCITICAQAAHISIMCLIFSAFNQQRTICIAVEIRHIVCRRRIRLRTRRASAITIGRIIDQGACYSNRIASGSNTARNRTGRYGIIHPDCSVSFYSTFFKGDYKIRYTAFRNGRYRCANCIRIGVGMYHRSPVCSRRCNTAGNHILHIAFICCGCCCFIKFDRTICGLGKIPITDVISTANRGKIIKRRICNACIHRKCCWHQAQTQCKYQKQCHTFFLHHFPSISNDDHNLAGR